MITPTHTRGARTRSHREFERHKFETLGGQRAQRERRRGVRNVVAEVGDELERLVAVLDVGSFV